MNSLYTQCNELIASAKHIVIIQADNPDGDSVSSALCLEAILEDMGKQTTMVCGVDMPQHLQYLQGWDRVQKEVPHQFDLSILVDASTATLLESMQQSGQLNWVKARPMLVIDHHQTSDGIEFAHTVINEVAVCTGEVIYNIATQNNWKLPLDAMRFIAISILSDSLGLTSEGTTVKSIRILADCVEKGVSLSELDAQRKELMKKEPELLHYKGRLLERVEFLHNDTIATVTIPWQEIEQYSQAYNPPMLIMEDLRMTTGVGVIIAFKTYANGRVTAKIRCNPGFSVASDLAEHFGGGGHAYAAGFKVQDVKDFEALKSEVIAYTKQLIDGAA